VLSLTPNEATIAGGLAGAALGAIASIFTTRHLVRHAPNYGDQITDIHRTLAALAETQENLRQQMARTAQDEKERHVAVEKRAEAARWKPITKIISKLENNDQVNILRLESSEEFALLEVSLCAQDGAKIHEYPTDGSKFTSKGFTLTVTRESLNKIANTSSSYFQHSVFDAALRYVVLRGGQEYTGEVPIHAEVVFNTPNMGIKLSG
jgi:hypothetical protein